MKAGKVRRRKW